MRRTRSPRSGRGRTRLPPLPPDPAEEKIQCLECGRWLKSLIFHLRIHDITCAEYKEHHDVRYLVSSGYRLSRTFWTKAELVRELRRIHRSGESLSHHDIAARHRGQSILQGARIQFGSYEAAIRAAGFDYDRIRETRSWSKEKVIAGLKRRVAEGLPINTKALLDEDEPLYQAAQGWFGTYEKAVREAGFEYDKVKIPFGLNRARTLRRIQARARGGWSLRRSAVGREAPSLLTTAERWFGSWRQAVIAAGFDYDRMTVSPAWSKESVLAEIRKRDAQDLLLTFRAVREIGLATRGESLFRAAVREFESYPDAINAAGLRRRPPLIPILWTPDRVVSALKERAGKNLQLNAHAVQKSDLGLYVAARKRFGSYRRALEAAGFEWGRVAKTGFWTEERVMEGLRRRMEQRLPLNMAAVKRTEGALVRAAAQLFGSYRRAVEALGLDYEQVRLRTKWDDDKVLRAIRDRARQKRSLRAKDAMKDDPGLFGQAAERFRSWARAVTAAGLDYEKIRGTIDWSKQRVLDEIRRRIEDGLPLAHRDLKGPAEKLWVAATTYFGSYESALRAAGIDYAKVRALQAWSKRKVLDALKRRRREGKPVHYVAMREADSRLAGAAKRWFGSYDSALRAAGWDPREIRLRQRRDGHAGVRQPLPTGRR